MPYRGYERGPRPGRRTGSGQTGPAPPGAVPGSPPPAWEPRGSLPPPLLRNSLGRYLRTGAIPRVWKGAFESEGESPRSATVSGTRPPEPGLWGSPPPLPSLPLKSSRKTQGAEPSGQWEQRRSQVGHGSGEARSPSTLEVWKEPGSPRAPFPPPSFEKLSRTKSKLFLDRL